MVDYLSMPDIITGTPNEVLCRSQFRTKVLTELQKAARINYFLGQIHDLLAEDENISKQVRYHIKERGENDRNRLAKILDFQEVDQDTLTVLGQNFDHWKEDPGSFWIRPMSCSLGIIAPQAQIVGCYIQTRRDDA